MKTFKLGDTVDIINFGTNNSKDRSIKCFLSGCSIYKSIDSKGIVHENYVFIVFDKRYNQSLREYYAGDSYPYMRVCTCRMVLFEKRNKYLIIN